MKNYFKTNFFIKLLSLILVCLYFSCETEKVNSETENLGIVVKILDFNQLNKTHNITNKLSTFSVLKSNPFSKSKRDIFYNAPYDFYINTDYAKYVEYEDYHSYNFSIIKNNSDSHNLENLLLSLNSSGGYDAYILTYGFTKEEFETIDITQLKNRETHFQPIDFDASFLSKGNQTRTVSSKGGGCIETWVVVERDPDEGELVGADDMHDSYFELVLESRHCSTWGGNGSTGGNNGGPSGPGGGSSGGSTSGPGDDSTLSSPINQDGSHDECVAVFDVINNYYSGNSPFNVDLSGLIKTPCDENISTDEVENEKLLCIYDKLAKSAKFKDLFIDTFGDSENLNIKFKVSDTLTAANGRCVPNTIKVHPFTKKIISADIDILINKNILTSNSAISVARTVLHESIHAYLMVKQYGCNQGTPFQDMGDKEMAKLLNEYFEECEPLQGQHEFMFNFMIPTMSGILADIKDDLIPDRHQTLAEEAMFVNENNPATWSDGSYKQDTPWNWDSFYEYLSMAGLQESSAFRLELGDADPADERSPEYINYYIYAIEYGKNRFDKNCQ